MKNTKSTVIDIAFELKNTYDYISELDAIKYLKPLFPNNLIKDFELAYNMVYLN